MDDAPGGNQGPAADAGERLVAVRNMSKTYSASGADIEIFNDADFELECGETVAVIGPSGIGKSTFLHMLGALDKPDRGEILFRGTNILGFDKDRLARFRNASIGFVFQFHHLLPEFSALENAMMPALINGVSKPAARAAAEATLTRVGLENRLSHRVSALSGGEQQRVALARALALKPDLLLADEPTGNLDKKNSEQVHRLLIELNREFGMTLLVVTHNMELAALMNRIITISDGRLKETA